MRSAELEQIWSELQPPGAASTGLAGRPAPVAFAPAGTLLALDGAGQRHLLIPAAHDDAQPRQPATKGVEAKIDELSVEHRGAARYFDLACREPSLNANFAAVAVEILDELSAAQHGPRVVIDRVLARWRWFWGAPAGGLSHEAAIGLFGELWFLEHWLAPLNRDVLAAWSGPLGDRHDVKWESASIEVKATTVRSDGAATHRITSLSQLGEPEKGALYLFSLRVQPDPLGAHNLPQSVDRLRRRLARHPEALLLLDERLGRAGFSPAAREQLDARFRVHAEELYQVGEGFPRLTSASFPDGLPAGVDSVAYTIDLAACFPWRVATAPGEVSLALRRTLDEP